MPFIFIYVTTSSETEAKTISKHLLEKKLIACANIFPSKSIYHWDNKLVEEPETTLILKTEEKNYNIIKQEILKIHSYDIPCITKISVKPNEKYANWLQNQLK